MFGKTPVRFGEITALPLHDTALSNASFGLSNGLPLRMRLPKRDVPMITRLRTISYQQMPCFSTGAPRRRIERPTCPLGGGCSIH